MALTVKSAFAEFATRITPTTLQRALMTSRRGSVETFLRERLDGSNMPLLRTRLIGSAGRATIIRPIDDVDVLAVFDPSLVWATYQFEPSKFLYRVRDALKGSRVEVVGARGQAVRLFYKIKPHVEIVPAFEISGGGYRIPGTGGWFGSRWIDTNPDRHAEFMTARHEALDKRLKPMIRLLKRWNNVHSKRLRAFHLEVLTATTFGRMGTDTAATAMHFCEWAPGNLHVRDPAGYSGDLASGLTSSQRSAIDRSFRLAHARAAKAVAAEASGRHQTAIGLWRVVFGKEFPAYG